jgi:hypothetical protein
VSKQQATLNAKLRGHYRYYGRPTYDPLLTWLTRRNIESDEFIALDKRMFGACS